ncbi:hypothetical protein H4W31_004862 [Plantactinospora soyae]|uniref:Uncharacterized protein n=1 Tax=Plantactinospora soyae TaxID=1544732 RepID=A0A927R799_9ACTN|nr:hypothetical protein [Plantactinospora soyae]
MSRDPTPRWYSPAEVAVLLGFGISRVKMRIATGELALYQGRQVPPRPVPPGQSWPDRNLTA